MYCDPPTHETVLVWSTFEGHLKLAGTHPQLSGWRASQNTITVGETSTGPHNQPAGAGLKPPPMYVRPPKRTTPSHITTWSVPQSLQLICLGSGFTPLTSYPRPRRICMPSGCFSPRRPRYYLLAHESIRRVGLSPWAMQGDAVCVQRTPHTQSHQFNTAVQYMCGMLGAPGLRGWFQWRMLSLTRVILGSFPNYIRGSELHHLRGVSLQWTSADSIWK